MRTWMLWAVLLLVFGLFGCGAASPPGAVEGKPFTYEGAVSGVKEFKGGSVAINLDGAYPNQKMTIYLPKDAAKGMPANNTFEKGDRVKATGTFKIYKGRPEIVMDDWRAIELVK